MSIAEMMRKARKEKHITQQQLADAVNMSVMSIRRYESRNEKIRRTPTVVECQKIADVLDLHWWEMMGLDDYGNGVYLSEPEDKKMLKLSERLSTTLTNSNDEISLLKAFNTLNDEGKSECLKRVLEMTELKRYCDTSLKGEG